MKLTYQNPVWPEYFADPFVLKWQGAYWAYGTGNVQADDRCFPVLHSTDFVHWEHIGCALEPPDPTHTAYWAPEVAERDGRFYLYYSAASGPSDDTHRLRVAVADHPAGPFRNTGEVLLPNEGFTIDPHAFRDPRDGRWYLFFAKDFFDARVGTGLAVVPLADDMIHTAGPVTTVLRPSADWQIYERNRALYGQTWAAWHTVEGPFVVARAGRYYCFYSGGNWQTHEYGVGYGVADHVLGPYRDEWSQAGASVLRGIPNTVLGPGHNSIVRGPDDQTEFIVYHTWDVAQTARRMCIDPLIWTADGPRCLGPTTTLQTIELPLAPR